MIKKFFFFAVIFLSVSTGVLCISFDINWGMAEEEILDVETGLLIQNVTSYEYPNTNITYNILTFAENLDNQIYIERKYTFWKNQLFSLNILVDCSNLNAQGPKLDFEIHKIGLDYLEMIEHLPYYPDISGEQKISKMQSYQISCLLSYINKVHFNISLHDIELLLVINKQAITPPLNKIMML